MPVECGVSVFQPVEEIDVHGMDVTIHHDNDGQPYRHLCGRHDHDEKHEQLRLDPCSAVRIQRKGGHMMHLGKSHQQQVHRVQHQFDAHEYDDRIPSGEDPRDPNTEKYGR